MDKILLLLLKKGAMHHAVSCSTLELGSALSMSQQNASRRLIELEQAGKIQRVQGKIQITEKGTNELVHLYRDLKAVLENEKKPVLRGKIIDGLREGAYYLSLPGYQKPLEKALGFTPYPGTLNLKLDPANTQLHVSFLPENGMFIPGFEWKNRSFGGLYLYPCRIENLQGAILRPVRTHHPPNVLELVAAVNIRKKLKKKAGDWVVVRLR